MIEIKVPATSANLGPGFDSMGLALKIYNTFKIKFSGSDISTTVINKADNKVIPLSIEDNLLIQAAKYVFNKYACNMPGFELKEIVDIPFARGLGSSATAVLAGVLAANYFMGSPMDDKEVLKTIVEIEGHPDNVIPAYKGGLIINASREDNIPCYSRICINKSLKITVAVPDFTLKTAELRKVIPEKIDREDAVFNHSRTALLTSCFCSGDYTMMSEAVKDRMHQDYRTDLIPGFYEVLDSAYEHGACGAALSGAGPSVIAFCPEGAEEVGEAMKKAFSLHDIRSSYFVTKVDNKGALILD